jgi:hypothetical protein
MKTEDVKKARAIARELLKLREEERSLKDRKAKLKERFDEVVPSNGVVQLAKEGTEAFWKFTDEHEVPAHSRKASWSISFRRIRKGAAA